MTRTKIDLSPERQLITQMILSKRFAQEILPLLKPRSLKTRYAQVVSEWVQEYFDRFEDAPGKAIQDIYLEKRKTLRDEEEQESVAEFLQNLSDDAKPEENIDYYIEQSIRYLKTRALELAVEDIQQAISSGDPMTGEGVISNFKRVGRPEGDGFSILDNPGDIISAFTDESEVVLTFPGAIGKITGPGRRGDLLSFIAPPKRGKTWALLYAAEMVMSVGHRATFITLEMPKNQILRRGWQSFSASPVTDKVVRIPSFVPDIEYGEEITADTKYRVEYKNEHRTGVDLTKIPTLQEKYHRFYRGGECRFIPMPGKSTTVKDIETVLDNLHYYNEYSTDVLIIDYADLLGAKANDYRHQLDDIWSNLKRLAQERNILVITATQTNRAGIGNGDITTENVAEDMRKLAHVSMLIALNQTAEDKEKQVLRWKVLLDRDEQTEFDEAYTIQCLPIGKFALDSKLGREMLK